MPITRRKRATPPEQPENNTNHATTPVEGSTETPQTPPDTAMAIENQPVDETMIAPPTPAEPVAEVTIPAPAPTQVPVQPSPSNNGEQQQTYTPPIESGRRTARGELFRRPPQVPPVQPPPALVPVQVAPLQPPTHEISLPLGNLLHLAYNPGYTGADEARSALLHKLASESKAGGRARCWSCGSIAIMYDRWSTRNKTFGDIGVAFCEICGVWSVM
jgi:hypothetical protein